jgi:hypothetical protein
MRFHGISSCSMMFHEILWSSIRFYDVSVNQSVPTEVNRGVTSDIKYMFSVYVGRQCRS